MYMSLWSKFTLVSFISNSHDLLKLLIRVQCSSQQNRTDHPTFCRYAFSEKAILDVLILSHISKIKMY